jgi:hypothetical protein
VTEHNVRVASTTAPADDSALESMLDYLERSPALVGPVLGVYDGRVELNCQVRDEDDRGAVYALTRAWQELLDAGAAAQVDMKGWYSAEAHATPYTGD